MDEHWQGTIQINAPVDRVYAYLADFPKHCEWAQTLDRMELKRSGDASGVGSIYKTFELQAMQADRKPRGAFPAKAMKGLTECTVTALEPNTRIAWKAHPIPVSMGVHAELEFELQANGAGGTKLTQRVDMHQPWPVLQIFSRFAFKTNPSGFREKADAQWQASLNNIKAILEE